MRHISGKSLMGLCAALVALPLSPCAFFTSACCQRASQAAVEVESEPARPCCAHHEPTPAPTPRDKKPCNRECCRISPFAPLGEKLTAPLPLDVQLADLPRFDEVSWSSFAPLAIAVPQPLSLNILHCRWRC